MAQVGSLVKELNCWLCFVSHLATPEGKPHEEGGRVMIRHFKGSRAIGFWAHELFGMERNTQAEDEEERKVTTFRVLKGRLSGDGTGDTFGIRYDKNTGRMSQCDTPTGFSDISDEAPPF
jgi:twinkle protein